jgi:hypothetical protein
VTAFKSDLSSLLYSTYLGGKSYDYGYAVAVDSGGNAFVTGQTLSTNFPVFNAYKSHLTGTNDAFLAMISPMAAPFLVINPSLSRVQISLMPPAEWETNGLETATNMITTNWVNVTIPPVLTNGIYLYTLPQCGHPEYFRYRH